MPELSPGVPKAVGYEAVPEGGAGPGVLVLHAWWGLNGVMRELCDRLAAAGFVAVAPDLWGGTVATTQDEAQSLVDQRDDAAIAAAADAALEHLKAHSAVGGRPVGALGFSFGAAWALHLSAARPDDLRAVTIFYGTYGVDFAAARAAYQGHFAADDPWEPAEGVAEMEAAMRAAGREVELHTYPGTGHWFFESDRPDAYNAEAAALAWERTLSFLRARLG
jgi:carboxymethylenebutenolidase